jgi:cation-transporting ATPase 13A1
MKDSKSAKTNVEIVRRLPFTSSLKRMATISSVSLPASFFDREEAIENTGLDRIPKTQGAIDTQSSGKYLVAVKGAPEVLRGMYKNLPEDFDAIYKHFAMSGSRVLALGFKWMDAKLAGKRPEGIKEIDRSVIEKDLLFAGFLVFHCPLKPDTAEAIRELHESMHRVSEVLLDFPSKV